MTLHLSPIRNPARTLLILGVTAAAGLSLLAAWSASSGPKVLFDARCEAWDHAATAAVAELIADRSPGGGAAPRRRRVPPAPCPHLLPPWLRRPGAARLPGADGRPLRRISPERREPHRRTSKRPLMRWEPRSPTGAPRIQDADAALRPPYFHD
jgi:hypothetical protein